MAEKVLFRGYLADLTAVAAQGDAREESFYPALADFLAAYARATRLDNVHVTTLPKPTEAGNPDFRVWDGHQHVVGYIEAKAPTAPTVSKVAFPSLVKVGQEQTGLVRFEDPDGDIVRAEFSIVEGDPATIQVKPGPSFDPGVSGRTSGSFGFTVIVT
ncbi:MAG: hypothetical protein NUV94_05945, partial [Candidatus Acetothermia bacterium]|nr:hypothetical protein [Candidatus Acetothermia bacterium]